MAACRGAVEIMLTAGAPHDGASNQSRSYTGSPSAKTLVQPGSQSSREALESCSASNFSLQVTSFHPGPAIASPAGTL